MRKFAVVAVLAVLVLTGAWLVMGSGPSASPHAPPGPEATPTELVISDRARDPAPGDAREPSSRAATKAEAEAEQRAAARRERDILHKRIATAVQAREQASPPTAVDDRDRQPTPGGLTDRTGKHGYLLDVMNHDLLPLADECYALARETDPELAGMLIMSIELIGDDELGGVVETAEPASNNELANADLIECVRESLLSTTLPPPPTDGRDALELSLRLEPET